jgi:uncharacterized secreted protein with C-terminal beta-propeller domain
MKRRMNQFKRGLAVSFLTGILIASQGFLGVLTQASDLSVTVTENQATEGEEHDRLIRINSYEELLKVLKEKSVITTGRVTYHEMNTADMTSESAMMSNAYSTTNVQVKGVDEADTFKNDSRYIYQRIENNKIAIIDTKDQLRRVGLIEAQAGDNLNFDTMFLDQDKLVVVGKRKQIGEAVKIERAGLKSNDTAYYVHPYKNFTVLQIYDLSNKRAPQLRREIELEGNMSEVRKIGQTVYMVTRRYNNLVAESKFTEQDILPFYKDSLQGSTVKTIAPDQLWYQPWKDAQYTTLMAAVEIDKEAPIEVQGVIGAADEVYMNQESVYFTSHVYDYRMNTKTYINKYRLGNNKITYEASGHVKGSVLNQFSMDEYKGNFRIATTSSDGNGVYILDSQLKTIGQLEKLAPGERIYSVRFTEDKGYVVTFKQVDPLFTIDLSNPHRPKVLGELKIPGFSQYLHPIGEHLVVGIGRSTEDVIRRDEKDNEIVVGVIGAGIKLSLFDVKNPEKPKEVNHIILGTNGSYSGALENHKMVTVHNEKQLLAIPISIHYDQTNDIEDFQGAYVFGIEKGRLVGKAKLGKIGQYRQYGYYQSTDRVCYIGEKLYFLYDNKINEYELDTFSRVQTLQLD